tara:strand:- start:994 stop:1437 length:444 start_codon:yes stop_codon:yes gene_type:complete
MAKTKEERKAYMKAYMKAYRENHKEEKAAQNKAYSEEHKEERKAYMKAYNKEYNEKHKEEIKVYRQSSEGKKSRRINGWKRYGIISDDWNSLYEKVMNTKFCENCGIQLTEGRYSTPTTRCLDHDHSITDKPNVRNVLCVSCNVKRG